MTILPILLGLVTPTQLEAQAAYDRYLAQFANSSGISGATNSSTMGERKSTVFRILPGGIRLVHEPTRIEFCDGKQQFLYSHELNQYIVGPAEGMLYGLLFGARFAPPGFQPQPAKSYKESDEHGVKTEVIEFAMVGNLSPGSITVVQGRPTSISFFGRQAMWTVNLHELHWTRVVRPESVQWAPPAGAQKVDFLKGP